MANINDGPPIRLRPRRSRRNPNDDPRRYAGVLGSVLRFAQMASRTRRRNQSQSDSHTGQQSHSPRLYSQRVSVRVTYAKNKNQGQWKAHGRYIARDSATHGCDPSRAGFDATRANLNVGSVLDAWQRDGDERLFKVIVSPEFGERMDLQDHTRKLIQRMERDLGTHLRWVAAAHFNTEHAHVHIALRGIDQNGSPLRIPRDYIRSGIRFHAENLATEALGFRTERDAAEARQREITQARYTSLDRIIQRSNDGESSAFTITTDITAHGCSDRERILQQDLSARLAHLEKMGLAKSVASQQWVVQSDFETVLRTLQQTVDRQKMLAAHGALLSDPRLPFEITGIWKLKAVEGRVLLHAEDEVSGRRYLLLEGTDAKVHLIYHTQQIEEARRAGKLAVNSFVRLEKRFADRIPHMEISDCGDADALLANRTFMNTQAKTLLRQGIAMDHDLLGGWLGQYHKVLRTTIERQAISGKERLAQSSGRQR
jgi:type IV secretory pathway VirD2 relaxase